MKPQIAAVANFMSLGFHVIMAWLAQQKKLSVYDVGEVSSRYDTVFAPAGITFAIWGVIYVLLTAFCIFHLIKAFGADEADQANIDLRAIGWNFLINSLATGAWLIAWVNEELLTSLILIAVQLITLIWISIRAHISNPARPLSSKIFTYFPLSVYFGWISIATIANVSAWLVSAGWDGAGISASSWTVIMIGVAALLTLFIVLVRRNIFFGLVVLWALYGIILKRQSVSALQYENVINAAWAAFLIISFAILIRLFRKGSDQAMAGAPASAT